MTKKTKQKYKIFSVRLTLEDYGKLEKIVDPTKYEKKNYVIARLINQEFKKFSEEK